MATSTAPPMATEIYMPAQAQPHATSLHQSVISKRRNPSVAKAKAEPEPRVKQPTQRNRSSKQEKGSFAYPLRSGGRDLGSPIGHGASSLRGGGGRWRGVWRGGEVAGVGGSTVVCLATLCAGIGEREGGRAELPPAEATGAEGGGEMMRVESGGPGLLVRVETRETQRLVYSSLQRTHAATLYVL
jgi:hypothetical protein